MQTDFLFKRNIRLLFYTYIQIYAHITGIYNAVSDTIIGIQQLFYMLIKLHIYAFPCNSSCGYSFLDVLRTLRSIMLTFDLLL